MTTAVAGAREAPRSRSGDPSVDEEVVRMVLTWYGRSPLASVQDDPVALAEIEWCGELMIAASAAGEERLSAARIDEVLEVASAVPSAN